MSGPLFELLNQAIETVRPFLLHTVPQPAASSTSSSSSLSPLGWAVLCGTGVLFYRMIRYRRQRGVQNKLCVVTGASSGIGAATARLLAAKGATIVLVARTASKLREAADEINALYGKGRAIVYEADCGQGDEIKIMSERVMREHGTPAVLVNAAGAGAWKYLEETPMAEAEQMVRAPFMAALFASQSFLPAMMASNAPSTIVNINSPVALVPWPGATVYAATRGALKTLSESLAQDLRGTRVTVLHVVLGVTHSSYFAVNANASDRLPYIANIIPSLQPSECARVIVDGIERRHHEIIYPFTLKFLSYCNWVAPGLTSFIASFSPVQRGVWRG